MDDPFKIEEGIGPRGAVVLRVHGRLDARHAPELVDCCTAARVRHPDLVLNLSGVEFIASSGIGSLLSICEEHQQQGGRVRFAALSPAVDAVVRLLNLDQFLALDVTEEDSHRALAA
jgi:anti-anti-sigma factor